MPIYQFFSGNHITYSIFIAQLPHYQFFPCVYNQVGLIILKGMRWHLCYEYAISCVPTRENLSYIYSDVHKIIYMSNARCPNFFPKFCLK